MKQSTLERNILIGVDIQNDFIDGSLAVESGESVVQPINEVAEAVRLSEGQVIFTRDWHPETTPHFDTWPVHCVAETQGAEFHPDLVIKKNDFILSKGQGQTDGYSGWEGHTEAGLTLEDLIEPVTTKEKVSVFIGGLATDYCVSATALDIAGRFANDERVSLYLIRDAVRAVNLTPTDELRALDAMEAAKFFSVSSEDAKRMIEESIR